MADEGLPPIEQLASRVIAMPRDTNPSGDIFGGWILSQMDLAGSSIATHASKSRVVLVAVNEMSFIRPVFVGDEVSCYAQIESIGRTSMRLNIQAWVKRPKGGHIHKVTQGIFTFVALDDDRKPRPVPRAKE